MIQHVLVNNGAHSATFAFRENTNDRHVISALFESDEYGLFGVGPGDVVLDIGAHIGGATVRVATQGATVYAYEVLSANVELLRENAAPYPNAHVFHEAVMGHDGSAWAYAAPYDPWHRWIGAMHYGTDEKEWVPCVSLDTIFKRNNIEECAVLKIDVEGSEYEILREASTDTLMRINRIVGEYHGVPGGPQEPFAALVGYMRGLFTVKSHDGIAAFDFVRAGGA